MLLADILTKNDIPTWPSVVGEAIKAALILVPLLAAVAMAWINLKNKIADNTVKTLANQDAIADVQRTASQIKSQAVTAVETAAQVAKTVDDKTDTLQLQLSDVHDKIEKLANKG